MLLAARMSIVQPLNRAALQAPPTRKKQIPKKTPAIKANDKTN